MEYLLVLILIIGVVIVFAKRSVIGPLNSIINEVVDIKKEIRQLKSLIETRTEQIKEQIGNAQTQEHELPLPETDIKQVADEEKLPSYSSISIIQPALSEKPDEITTGQPEPETQAFIPAQEPIATFTDIAENIQQGPVWKDEESILKKWLRNNPDLEKFIGENLINKIGIAILVLGIGFFVKYAIDKDWINETGRVCIGLGCGAILVGIAHFMRNSYRSFSSVLAGGGIAVFYFTIAFGFHQYHLMSQTAAFVIMVVITAFAIALSVLYDKMEIAIIATVGGFIAPFLVSTGDGNYIVLFTYLIILNIGILSLAYFKRWLVINIIALFFTVLIYGGWLATVLNEPAKHISYPVSLLFASVFYFLFLGMNMVHQIKNKAQFKPFDFFILLLINSTYFAAGILLLHSWNNGAYQGLFVLLLGIVNLALTYYVYKKGKTDRNLLFLLIGITLTFITLTIPVQLHGHAITLFWSAEFVLLYWLSEYSEIRLFKYSCLLICLLTLISLGMDWAKAANTLAGLLVIYNNIQGIVTNLVATAAFATWFFLLRKKKDDNIAGISNQLIANTAIFISAMLLFITCIFGVNLYYHTYTSYAIPNVYHCIITEIFALSFIFIAQKNKNSISPWLQVAALVICFIVLLCSIPATTEMRDMILSGKAPWIHLYAHWIGSLLLVLLFYKTIRGIRDQYSIFIGASKILSLCITIMAITFLSIELLHIYVIAGYHNGNTHLLEDAYSRAGLTVVWAICSFALMWLGMKHSERTLRIISLFLFSIVLLKLFIIDISDISEGGKILAFILLGVLLLTVSFMYQKLKKIIIDNKKK